MYFTMATVYILYSDSIDQYYTGSCLEFTERLEMHWDKGFSSEMVIIAVSMSIMHDNPVSIISKKKNGFPFLDSLG